MIKIDQTNKWAIDLALHIPVPSISIKITNTEKETMENVPLQHGEDNGSQKEQ